MIRGLVALNIDEGNSRAQAHTAEGAAGVMSKSVIDVG